MLIGGKEYKTGQRIKIINAKSILHYKYGMTGLDKQLIGFRNGYGSSRPQFTAVCSLDVKTGKEEWGAEPGKEYYTLHIHKIRERSGC